MKERRTPSGSMLMGAGRGTQRESSVPAWRRSSLVTPSPGAAPSATAPGRCFRASRPAQERPRAAQDPCAVRSGLRVVYAEADELLGELVSAAALERRKLLKPIIEADLLVLDDLFMTRRIAQESTDQLQALVHQRYKLRRSNLITSNRIIADWEKYLGDSALASTILDRLMHRSVLVEFRGRSYRLKEAARRLVKGDDSE